MPQLILIILILISALMQWGCPPQQVHVISRIERITWNSNETALLYHLEDGHEEELTELHELGSPLEYIETQNICFP